MPFVTAQDLKEDVLFRASESTTASQFNDQVIDYLNRAYRTVAAGSSEFLPEFVEDWWWLRKRGAFIMRPVLTEGTVDVTNGDTAITFSNGISPSIQDQRIRIGNDRDVFVIAEHADGATSATLDTRYTGETNLMAEFKVFWVVVDFAGGAIETISDASAIISPMQISDRLIHRAVGMSPERMDELFPPGRLDDGVPTAFALESETKVRFNRGGRLDKDLRVDFWYRPTVETLSDSDASIPLVPLQYRQVLADIALTYLMVDKNDDRVQAAGGAARNTLSAMVKENRHRLSKIDEPGHIAPRQSQVNQHPLLTESGLVVR